MCCRSKLEPAYGQLNKVIETTFISHLQAHISFSQLVLYDMISFSKQNKYMAITLICQ